MILKSLYILPTLVELAFVIPSVQYDIAVNIVSSTSQIPGQRLTEGSSCTTVPGGIPGVWLPYLKCSKGVSVQPAPGIYLISNLYFKEVPFALKHIIANVACSNCRYIFVAVLYHSDVRIVSCRLLRKPGQEMCKWRTTHVRIT